MKTTMQAHAPVDGRGLAPELILAGHSGTIAAAAFSPDGQTLVTSGRDGQLLFWNLPSLELRHAAQWPSRARSEDNEYLTDLAYSPDGKYLAASDWRKLYLLDPATGRVTRKFSDLRRPFAVSPDGNRIVCDAWHDGMDDPFALFDTEKRKAVRYIDFDSSIDSVAFSADGELFGVTGHIAQDKTESNDFLTAYVATICDAATGDVLHQWCWEHEIEISAWPRTDGPRLLVFVPEQATLWDAETGNVFESVLERHSLSYLKPWYSKVLSFASSGPYLVVASPYANNTEGYICLWRIGANDSSPAHVFATGQLTPKLLAFSPDGSRFATTGDDSTLKVWQLGDEQEPELLGARGAPRVELWKVTFTDDSAALRIYMPPGLLREWNVAAGEVGPASDVGIERASGEESASAPELGARWLDLGYALRGMTLQRRNSRIYETLAVFSPDGRFAVVQTSEKETQDAYSINASLWNVATGLPIAEVKGLKNTQSLLAAFSPDGNWLAIGSGRNGFRLLDGRTGELRRELSLPMRSDEGRPLDEPAISFAFSSDGKNLATGHFGFFACIWDLRTGRLKRRILADRDDVSSLSFAADGKTLAVGMSYWENISLYGLGRGGRKQTVKGHFGSLRSLAYSPNGRWLASAAGDGAVKLWDASTLQCLATLRLLPEGDEYILTTPDGYYSGSEGVERYFRVRRGGEIVRDEELVRSFRRPVVFEP